MPGHRPEFGDTLIPTLARGIGNIDSIAREAMRARERQDTRDQELAIENRRFQAQQENLGRGEARKGFEESTRNVISLNKQIRNLESQRKNLANLERTGRLPKKGKDRLAEINKELNDARSELRDATNIREQAGRITGLRPGTPMGVISSLGLGISDLE
jgi:methyl-accepting chemotaxis protein